MAGFEIKLIELKIYNPSFILLYIILTKIIVYETTKNIHPRGD